MTEKDQIEQLSYHILSSYFEHLDIKPFLSAMAEDIIWLGAGKAMRLSGYNAVSAAFHQGVQTMHHCILSEPVYDTKQLSPDIWLCQICAELTTAPDVQPILQEYQRCAFIFRRKKRNYDSSCWEIIYLNNSMAYKILPKESFFATEQGMRNYHRLHHVNLEDLSIQDRNELHALVERSAYRPLDADTQELFLRLSQFSSFSSTQAIFMWQRLDAADMLHRELEQHRFLYRDPQTGQYYFHPVYADYLRTHFLRQPPEWQHQQNLRAGRWFLTSGNYDEAILHSSMAHDDETLLTSIERGGLESLFSLPVHIPIQLLQRYLKTPSPHHIKGLLLALLHVCLAHSQDVVATYAPTLEALLQKQSLPLTLQRKYAAFLEMIKALSLYPDISAITTQAKRALAILPVAEYTNIVALPWTFGSPSMLSIYHRHAGNLSQEIETMDDFLSVYQKIHPPYAQEWHQFIHGEYDYMTGNSLRARQELTLFLQHTNLQKTHLDMYLSALFYTARLSVYTGEASILERYHVQMHTLALERQPKFYMSILTLCDAYISALTSTDATYFLETQQRMKKATFYQSCKPIAAMIYDRLSLARGTYTAVILDVKQHLAEFQDYTLPAIYEYIFLAAAYEQTKAYDDALQALEKAVTLALADHLVMPFAEHDEYLPKTIYKLQCNPVYANFFQSVQTCSLKGKLHQLRQFSTTKAKPDAVTYPTLTPREQAIAHLVAKGKTNKEIAKTLNIAEVTVKKTLSRLYKKVKVTNRAALTQYVLSRKKL